MPLQLTFTSQPPQLVPFDTTTTLSVTVTTMEAGESRVRVLAWSEITDLKIVDEPTEPAPAAEPEGLIEPVDAATSAPQKPRGKAA